MSKVILICGRICCGKSTYAAELRRKTGAVLLSVDEIMLSMFGLYAGEMHDTYAQRTQNYLFDKSVELIESGIDVILDWGFWTKAGRAAAREFYTTRGIDCEFHYIDLPDDVWQARIEQRNRDISAGKTTAYPVDDNLAAKFGAMFEPPTPDEIERTMEGEGREIERFMDDCTFTKLDPARIEEVVALSRQWAEEGITYGLVAGDAENFEKLDVWTCLRHNRVIAYLSGSTMVSEDMCVFPYGAKVFEIDELYVTPEGRSRDIGGQLFRHVEKEVKSSGVDHLLLSTATKDSSRIGRFYTRMGMDIWTTVFFKKL